MSLEQAYDNLLAGYQKQQSQLRTLAEAMLESHNSPTTYCMCKACRLAREVLNGKQ